MNAIEYISANFDKHYTLYDDRINDEIGGGGFIRLYKKIFVVLWWTLTDTADDDNDSFEFKFTFSHNEINIKNVLIRLIKDNVVSFNVDHIRDNSLSITITNFCDSNDCFNLVMKCVYALMIVDNADIEDCDLVSFLSDKLLNVVEDMSLMCNKHFSMFYTWMNEGIIKEVENPIVDIELNVAGNISKLEIPEY